MAGWKGDSRGRENLLLTEGYRVARVLGLGQVRASVRRRL